ncbi:MAG TPA: hypothetical protein VF418_11600 [Sphingomonadaceae bacterium]
MFNKYQNIFRSRWKALWWAAGVLLTAYCTVPSQDQKSAAPPIKLSTLNHMLHQQGPAKKAPDPWGYDSTAKPVRPQ